MKAKSQTVQTEECTQMDRRTLPNILSSHFDKNICYPLMSPAVNSKCHGSLEV